ncbi:MAG: hypothetical protein ABI330_03595 [Caldimonas sp.]|nr:hypothetical protein [Pseudomonadota bacterium]
MSWANFLAVTSASSSAAWRAGVPASGSMPAGLQRGELLLALAHTLAHVVGSLTAAAIGFKIAQALLCR